MTSANVTHYYVHRGSDLVLHTTQHHYCKLSYIFELKKIAKPKECTLTTNWPDEDECDNWTEHGSLAKYIQEYDEREEQRRRSGKIWTAARKEIERERPELEKQERLDTIRKRAEMIDYAIGERNWEEKLAKFFG